MKKCQVCVHEKVKEINDLILQNKMCLSDIARKYGIYWQSIYTHRKRHVKQKISKIINKIEQKALEKEAQQQHADIWDVWKRYRITIQEALALLKNAKENNDRSAWASAIARLEAQIKMQFDIETASHDHMLKHMITKEDFLRELFRNIYDNPVARNIAKRVLLELKQEKELEQQHE